MSPHVSAWQKAPSVVDKVLEDLRFLPGDAQCAANGAVQGQVVRVPVIAERDEDMIGLQFPNQRDQSLAQLV